MYESLQNFTQSMPDALQWIGVILISAIPFVESYLGAAIGVIAGLPLFIAIPAAVIGNFASMLLLVQIAHGTRRKIKGGQEPELSPRQQRIKRLLDRFGVPGVSLLGQWILPSQITSSLMVSFGASKNTVILWQTISIVLWGVGFGLLASLGVEVLAGR
ncbi:hypothetical protein FCK90_00320 [Kocuria coralli]|uniref:Small multi-drug export protein n=1 Tax=Kocuria coralli TaxID=1461025 RepID=A0A5J5L2S8_9MICC|nr:hypothetical protein [Kocuria coralli]KAA9395515.1 hypothetical protein FCK90_00320 [Kocuria coralli]